jgi:hypothetical protein
VLHGGYLLLAAAFNSDTASFLEKIKRNGSFDFSKSAVKISPTYKGYMMCMFNQYEIVAAP